MLDTYGTRVKSLFCPPSSTRPPAVLPSQQTLYAARSAPDRIVKPSLRNSLSLLICVTGNFAHVN